MYLYRTIIDSSNFATHHLLHIVLRMVAVGRHIRDAEYFLGNSLFKPQNCRTTGSAVVCDGKLRSTSVSGSTLWRGTTGPSQYKHRAGPGRDVVVWDWNELTSN